VTDFKYLKRVCREAFAACLLILWNVSPIHSEKLEQDKGYELLYGAKQSSWKRRALDRPLQMWGTEGSTGFDILHYVIDISIDPGLESVSGSVDVKFRIATTYLDSVFLHLKDNMNVSSVLLDASPLSFSHTQDKIYIDLGATYAEGETLTVTVNYDGNPVPQGLRFEAKVIYNLSEPDMARNWFPCYDEPWDKATSEMITTIPDSLFCASNGLLVSETDNLDGTKTYHWQTGYRCTTYTISVAISNYSFFSHWYHYTATDSMEMPYYIYPEKLVDAQVSFSNAPDMMVFFSEIFGEYPFVEEVYGTAHANVNGAMENFTCTTYGYHLSTGDHRYDWVVAHEMVHSWFGNSVTLAGWEDIWLNEGFATYGDALWHKYARGDSVFNWRMEMFKWDYFDEDSWARFPLYDPGGISLATVYQKGAWVLHMLSYVMGDSLFFEGLRSYHASYAYNNATTEDFRAVCEAISGMDLADFFSEWVYQAGYPEYQYAWSTYHDGIDYCLGLLVAQRQSNAPVFTIPIEVLISTASGDSLVQLPVSNAVETYLLRFPEEPSDLSFDPFNHILKKAVKVPTAIAQLDNTPPLSVKAFPNPAGSEIHLDFFLPEPGDVVVEVFDVAGRLSGRISRSNLPAAWNSLKLVNGDLGVNMGTSGVYFYRLKSGRRTMTGKFTVIR
jgi:aminopeptidase N